jgi:hypothetical protein
MLTVIEVIRRVGVIKEIAGDDEAAHSNEDDLHQAVLQAISLDQCDDPVGCATEALKTRDIEFERWCA